MSHVCNPPCEDAIVRAAPCPPPCAAITGRWVLAASVTGSSMAFIDGTVVNVALPALQRELDAGVAELQWVVESYMLLLASLILVGGALGDRYGRRRLFAIGTVVFAVTSVWCGLAPDSGQLIAARAAKAKKTKKPAAKKATAKKTGKKKPAKKPAAKKTPSPAEAS